VITLTVEARVTAEELTDKFSDFEIVEIKPVQGGYTLSVRTFFTGEHRIPVGDKDILITVRSALEDIERDGVFEGGVDELSPGFPFHFRELFIIALVGTAASGGVLLAQYLQKRKIKSISPRRLFMMRSAALSEYDSNFFVDLTFYFKEYLGSIYERKIIGKTSVEIIDELKDIEQLESMLPETGEWLTECDRMKFTGVEPSAEQKRGHYSSLVDLVRAIDDKNGEAPLASDERGQT